MRKIYALLCAVFTISCSTDYFEDSTIDTPDNTEKYLSLSDIKGVWHQMGIDDYFICIWENGKYSLHIMDVINDRVMDTGTCVIKEEKIELKSSISGATNELHINLKGDLLTLGGTIEGITTSFISESLVDLDFMRSDDKLPSPIIGKSWKEYERCYTSMCWAHYSILTDCVLKYKLVGKDKFNNYTDVIKDESWYYVHVNNMLYTGKRSSREIRTFNLNKVYGN